MEYLLLFNDHKAVETQLPPLVVKDHDSQKIDEVAASVRALGDILAENYENGERSFTDNEEL